MYISDMLPQNACYCISRLADIAFKAHTIWPREDAANVCFDGL